MTLFNIVSVVIFISLVIAAVLTYRWLRKDMQEADGLGSVNERGEIGTSDEGDIVGEIHQLIK